MEWNEQWNEIYGMNNEMRFRCVKRSKVIRGFEWSIWCNLNSITLPLCVFVFAETHLLWEKWYDVWDPPVEER